VTRSIQLRAALAAVACGAALCGGQAFAQAARPQAALSLEARVQRQEDTEAIRQLLREYGRRLDAGDLDGYANLFATDGEWIGGFGSVKGRAQIAPFMKKNMSTPNPAIEGAAAAAAAPRPGPRGVHLMTNEIIEVNGDRATVWSKWTYMSRSADNKPVPLLAGHYDDIVVRESGEWKFLKRVASGDIPYSETPK
jgi:uncharacterized protein (TIGR02246 family)